MARWGCVLPLSSVFSIIDQCLLEVTVSYKWLLNRLSFRMAPLNLCLFHTGNKQGVCLLYRNGEFPALGQLRNVRSLERVESGRQACFHVPCGGDSCCCPLPETRNSSRELARFFSSSIYQWVCWATAMGISHLTRFRQIVVQVCARVWKWPAGRALAGISGSLACLPFSPQPAGWAVLGTLALMPGQAPVARVLLPGRCLGHSELVLKVHLPQLVMDLDKEKGAACSPGTWWNGMWQVVKRLGPHASELYETECKNTSSGGRKLKVQVEFHRRDLKNYILERARGSTS